MVSQLVGAAVELVVVVTRVCATLERGGEVRRVALVDQLQRRLGSHEDAVLAGEVTYSVSVEQAEAPAACVRHAVTSLSRDPASHDGHLLSLTIAAVDLAALLIRLAANATASGRAGEAPQARTERLDVALRAITSELTTRAGRVERPVAIGADVVAHHLAAGLRIRFSEQLLFDLSAAPTELPGGPSALDELRYTWLGLATNEYVAVLTLDGQLEMPAYDRRFGGLSEVMVEGAANVICGGRLLDRPGAFRHRTAWRHQAVALTYAMEAYAAGLRGHGPSLAQAQLIALTRLVRAMVAIALIDLAHAEALPRTGSLDR
jgi:hypothetical protein